MLLGYIIKTQMDPFLNRSRNKLKEPFYSINNFIFKNIKNWPNSFKIKNKVDASCPEMVQVSHNQLRFPLSQTSKRLPLSQRLTAEAPEQKSQ